MAGAELNEMQRAAEAEAVMIDYTNWRGERRVRKVRPLSMRFDTSEWHQEKQWLMRAVDVEAGATRDFAMKDIHRWITGRFS